MSPLGKGIHAPRAFSPFTTLIFYFLFQKSQAEAKAGESRKGPGLGGSWLMIAGIGFWAAEQRGKGSQNFSICPSQA